MCGLQQLTVVDVWSTVNSQLQRLTDVVYDHQQCLCHAVILSYCLPMLLSLNSYVISLPCGTGFTHVDALAS